MSHQNDLASSAFIRRILALRVEHLDQVSRLFGEDRTRLIQRCLSTLLHAGVEYRALFPSRPSPPGLFTLPNGVIGPVDSIEISTIVQTLFDWMCHNPAQRVCVQPVVFATLGRQMESLRQRGYHCSNLMLPLRRVNRGDDVGIAIPG